MRSGWRRRAGRAGGVRRRLANREVAAVVNGPTHGGQPAARRVTVDREVAAGVNPRVAGWVAAVWVALCLVTPAPAAPPPLRCPLPGQLGLSATMGEFRDGHLHTGIDLRTGGRDGLPVVAAAAGRVARVRVNRGGYGNALYLEHAGGWVTVYGHLERFTVGAVVTAVARAQRLHGRYPGEVFLDQPVRVAAGEHIADSGESGAGLPHLHFELRDPDGEPVNPLPLLAALADARPPAIHRVRWLPADASGRVDGDFAPRTTAVAADATVPVRLAGRIAVQVEADDRFTSDNRCGLYEIALAVEGRELYRLRFDRMRFSRVPLSGLLYDLPRSALAPLHFLYKLYREPGNDLLAATGDGLLDTRDLAGGRHLLTVRARDVAGLESVATLPIVVDNRAAGVVGVVAAAPAARWRPTLTQVDCAVALRLPGAGAPPPLHLTIDDGPSEPIPLEPVAGGWLGVMALTPGGRVARVEGAPSGPLVTPLRWVVAERPAHHRLGPLAVDFPQGAPFAPLGLGMARVHLLAEAGLPFAAGPIALAPSGRVLAEDATATFTLPGVTDGRPFGIYRWSKAARRWSYIGGHWEEQGHTLAASLRALATVAVLEDRWVPRVIASRPAAGATLERRVAHPYVAVQERGEGVDEAGCRVVLDTTPLTFEYDPDRGWLRFDWPSKVAPGHHVLTVVVADQAGNRAPPTPIAFTLAPPAS